MNENKTATMYRFLNQLRESGSINMFDVIPVLAESFGISSKEAGVVLSHWMAWVSHNPDFASRQPF